METEKNKEVKQSFWRKWRSVIITVCVTLSIVFLIVVAGAVVLLKYYVGGGDIRRRALDAPLRSVLWEDPKPLPGYINKVRGNTDATISPDGEAIILAHEKNDGNYDLHLCLKTKNGWTKQIAIENLNSSYNERGPEISSDKRFLYFQSDRPGGFGGFDIWYSVRQGDGWNKWTRPRNLGDGINTSADEIDPAVSPKRDKLFFASNRPDSNADTKNTNPDFDLYVATADKNLDGTDDVVPKPPPYAGPENLRQINSPADERKAVVTPRENTIYFSSNRKGGEGGFDLYRSYFVEKKLTKPINFGTPINSQFDETSPTMTLEGFGIYFSSNKRSRNPLDFMVYQSVSREVTMKFDYNSLLKVIALFFLTTLAIFAIYLLLRLLMTDTRMSLLTKCLLAAVAIHLILAILFAFWFISSDLVESLKPAPKEMTINVNNLARDSIAMAIRESVASLPKVNAAATAERLPVPQTKPVSAKVTPTTATTVPKTAVSPVSVKTVAEIAPSQPPKGVPAPALKPFQPGATIKMESPPGAASGSSAPSSGESDNGIPNPKFNKPRRHRTPPRLKMDTVPMDMDVTMVEDPNARIADKNAMGPPSVERNLTQPSRVATTLPGKDPLAERLVVAAAAAPKGNIRNSFGSLFFEPKIKMEEKKNHGDMKPPPELGILTKDPNIAKAVELVLQMNMTDKKEVLAFLQDYARKNKLKFNSFAVVRALVAEGKLGNVDGVIYKTMPAFSIPADNEMELPEKYNR
jgi:Tol biopolymer transport system component